MIFLYSNPKMNLPLIIPLFRFGGAAMIARTVQQYIRAGIAALHIEDQVQTKRCGHLLGKQVVSREEFLVRIRAAVMARDSMPEPSDFVRNAFHIVLSTFVLPGLL
jgi:2-methylisocitrate lyase-like PEP mutase family enzyme